MTSAQGARQTPIGGITSYANWTWNPDRPSYMFPYFSPTGGIQSMPTPMQQAPMPAAQQASNQPAAPSPSLPNTYLANQLLNYGQRILGQRGGINPYPNLAAAQQALGGPAASAGAATPMAASGTGMLMGAGPGMAAGANLGTVGSPVFNTGAGLPPAVGMMPGAAWLQQNPQALQSVLARFGEGGEALGGMAAGGRYMGGLMGGGAPAPAPSTASLGGYTGPAPFWGGAPR